MRRLTIISLASVYFLLSMGINVLVHTCGGFRTVDMMPTSTTDPCGCTEEMSDDICCTLVLKVFHIDDDQKAVDKPLLAATVCSGVCHQVTMEIPDGQLSRLPVPADTSPPPAVSPIILNCTFLI